MIKTTHQGTLKYLESTAYIISHFWVFLQLQLSTRSMKSRRRNLFIKIDEKKLISLIMKFIEKFKRETKTDLLNLKADFLCKLFAAHLTVRRFRNSECDYIIFERMLRDDQPIKLGVSIDYISFVLCRKASVNFDHITQIIYIY